MLTGIHVLLTYKCTNECDHCFLHCGPRCKGTFTLHQLRELLREIVKIPTVTRFTSKAANPSCFIRCCWKGFDWCMIAGLKSGIVTNGYWATSSEDAEQWLWPTA